MKIRAIIVLALIVCGIVSTIFYVKANQVSTNEKAIIEAIQTKNTPALIQALISRMKNQLEKDVNTSPELIKEVETYAGTCPDSASVAILHSMIAEMYNNYYMQNRWNVNQRTELAGYVPDDIPVSYTYPGMDLQSVQRKDQTGTDALSPTGSVAATNTDQPI